MVLLLLALMATPAQEEAGARFQAGVRLSDAGDFAGALAEFEAAYRALPRPEVLFNIGVCERRLFRYGAAVVTFERYLEEGGDRVPAERRARVADELAQIRALVGEVEVQVEGAPARIEVDGGAAGTTPLARPLLLGPGRHTVRASRAGEAPDERTIEIVSGARTTLTLAPRAAPRTRLAVETRPPGAEVTVDRRQVGSGPWSGEVEPGGHEIVARAEGHRAARAEVLIAAGQTREVVLELEALPEEAPWYARWWIWAAAGAAVAGGAVAVALSSRTTPDVRVTFPE